jgi:hypothetical protein
MPPGCRRQGSAPRERQSTWGENRRGVPRYKHSWEGKAPIDQEAQPAADGDSPSPVGRVGQDKLAPQKTTPSGSKCRVPAARMTGPLKSPAKVH